MTLQRQLIQIVELDIERCSLTYGSSPCTAVLGTDGVRKCYNTFKTCQDTANFATSTETLRFAMNVDGLPRDQRIYPCMAAPVTTNPAKINLGGVSEESTGLGKRARVTIRLQDFKDSDIWFDRYQSERVDGTGQTDEGGYNPADRGTFFGKLKTRFPYSIGRSLRVLEGEVGQSLGSMRTRHYVVSEINGPNANGAVEIIAKDVLDLADNKKALCPTPSTGKLGANITVSSGVSFDLTPSGVGADYETSGRASIGSEIVDYTRSGDTITLTTRGLDGTDPAEHSQGDLFQEAYRAEGRSIAQVARDFLRDYAGISNSFIPFSDWKSEAEIWLAGFDLTGTIAKPTGVNKLISELTQLGVAFWWDDVDQEIKMRANRPLNLGETSPEISDDNVIIEKTTEVKALEKKRLSRILFWHGVIDATGSITDGNNYKRVSIAIDEDAESSDEYNQSQTYEIFCRWLGGGNDVVADAVANRMLKRFRDTPKQITFSFDAKDAANVSVASPITVISRVFQDDTGNSETTEMQVTALEEIIPGLTLKATAESYRFTGRYGFITENSRSDYTSATDEEKTKGTYIVGGSGTFGDGTGPYIMY